MSKLLLSCIVSTAALLTPVPAQDGAANPARATEVAAAKRSPPANLVVGVVDLDKAIEQYPKYIRGLAQLKQVNVAYDEAMQQQKRKIDELKGALSALREGTKERAMKQLEYESQMQNANALGKLYHADLNLEQMRLEIDCYQDIDAAVSQLAKDRGVHLVLRLDGDPRSSSPESMSPEQVQRRALGFERRKVWFASDELDLTASLIKMLQTFDAKDSGRDATKAETPPAPTPSTPNGKDGK